MSRIKTNKETKTIELGQIKDNVNCIRSKITDVSEIQQVKEILTNQLFRMCMSPQGKTACQQLKYQSWEPIYHLLCSSFLLFNRELLLFSE